MKAEEYILVVSLSFRKRTRLVKDWSRGGWNKTLQAGSGKLQLCSKALAARQDGSQISRSLEVATLSFYREVELDGDATCAQCLWKHGT